MFTGKAVPPNAPVEKQKAALCAHPGTADPSRSSVSEVISFFLRGTENIVPEPNYPDVWLTSAFLLPRVDIVYMPILCH